MTTLLTLPETTVTAPRQLQLQVRSLAVAADRVLTIELQAPGREDLPEWQPGAHVDVILRDGLVRQYSLCGDPADRRRWRLGVLREDVGRGGSEYVHAVLRPGDMVQVRGPRNHFPLVPAEHYLFIAGGIGITPILPMVAEVHRRGASYRLVYGGRSRSSMAFLEELERYGDNVTLVPQDELGLPDIGGLIASAPAGTNVYCCGPEPLIAAVERETQALPAGALHRERFAAAPTDPDAEPQPAGEAFEVELASSGEVLTVHPDQSVLEALEEAGVPILSSCREGICGTCETGVISGKPDHRDSLLSDEEKEESATMLVCVSRACGPRLVLDL
ncbi:MAG TPA: PDR/VanB family oxidoreductase [Actinomycetales bacterium]|nr:PDR/VanB family oxidoreductase [Actinomycetales bacterium]